MHTTHISNRLLHPRTIKIVSLIGIFGFLFVAPTFAATDSLDTVKQSLNVLLSLFSWLWIVFAILAGKLMTNNFVYGAFMHMDIYLWKIWNIMKNFANFALVGLVLWSIIKSLIGKEAVDVKKTLIKTLCAGILIQASWFLVGAVVDLSTVATTAIGAFPVAFLGSNTNLTSEITTGINTMQSKRLVIDLEGGGNISSIDDAEGINSLDQDLRKNILPSYNSISGPFIFLGMGIFQFQQWIDTNSSTDAVHITLQFTLRFFLLFFFTIGLLLLFVANVMRVGLLWIFIIGSPFLILAKCFEIKGDSKGVGQIFSFLSLSNFFAIVFKPVIFVAGTSLMLIVILSMWTTMSGGQRENNLNGIALGHTGSNISTLAIEGISNIEASQNDLFGEGVLETGQNIFSTLIVYLLAIFLMWRFIKLSLTIGGGPLDAPMKKLTGRAEDMARTAPVLPFAGGTSVFGAGKFMSKNTDNLLHGMGINKKGQFGGIDKDGQFRTSSDKFDNYINQKYLGYLPAWDYQDYKELKDIAKTKDATGFFTRAQELAKERSGGLVLNNAQWITTLHTLLQNPTDGFSETLRGTSEAELTRYFSLPGNAEALYNALGGPNATKGKKPTDYATLKDMVFYPAQ